MWEILGLLLLSFSMFSYAAGLLLFVLARLGYIPANNLLVPACISVIILVPGLPMLSALALGGLYLTRFNYLLLASDAGSALIILGWVLSTIISWLSYAIVGEESNWFNSKFLGCIPGTLGLFLILLGICFNLKTALWL